MKRFVAFDLGNVLLPFDHMKPCKALARLSGLSVSRIYESIFDGGLEQRFEAGELSGTQFLAACELALGVRLDAGTFPEIWSDIFEVDPGMERLLMELRSRVDLCLVSNTNPWHYAYASDRFAVVSVFPKRVLSYEIGCLKPDARVFAEVRKLVANDPHPIFIDDLMPNVEAAAASGFRAIHFGSEDALRRELAGLGVADYKNRKYTTLWQRKPLSRQQFKVVRDVYKGHRGLLSAIAWRLPRYATGSGCFSHAPLLCDKEWVPDVPINLGIPNEHLEDDNARMRTRPVILRRTQDNVLYDPEFRAAASRLLPMEDGASESFDSFHEAIRQIENPDDPDRFVSRPSYSLLRVDAEPQLTLYFREAEFFDHVDFSELLAFEFAHELNQLGGLSHDLSADDMLLLDQRLELRSHSGAWNTPGGRPSLAGVNVLTIFWDSAQRTATFPMMRRTRVLSAPNTDHVIPAGEFQPTTRGPGPFLRQCTLWQTILREFSEEILRNSEAKSHGLDMRALAALPAVRPLVDLIRVGAWRSYLLGVALDPLNLKPEVMVACVIEKAAFLEHAGDLLEDGQLPQSNFEGDLLRGTGGWGEEVTEMALMQFLQTENTHAAGRGCIELVLNNLARLLPNQ
jgi:FMN phosphatase YigB (HAD superfamily)